MDQQEYEVSIGQLLEDIGAYMDFLNNRQGLKVSVHRLEPLINSYIDNLKPWNYHAIPYCLCIKKDSAAISECRLRQIKLSETMGSEPFFGTCWAGVGEYVFPIPNPYSEQKGFISVTGYKGDFAKAKAQMLKISQKYDILHSELQMLYDGLDDDHPPISELTVLIKPLVYMFATLSDLLHNRITKFPTLDSASGRLFVSICFVLRNKYSIHYSLEDLGKMFNCSASHISHLFSKHAGCSYRTYVSNMRLDIAKQLLTSTHMNIQEISDHLGYVNANYFSTVFSRNCGMSPREYRNLNRQREQVLKP